MPQIISQQQTTNYEDDNWDDVEIPETGLFLMNNNNINDYGLSTTTRDSIHDSSDDDDSDYFGKTDYYSSSSKSTPESSSSLSSLSIHKVEEMINNNNDETVKTDNKKFDGLITRIRGKDNQMNAVEDDLYNNMEIPNDGFINLTLNPDKKRNNLDKGRDKNPISSGLIVKRIRDISKLHSKSNSSLQSKKPIESFDEDFDFSGDLDKLDLSTKVSKLQHQGSYEGGNFNDKDSIGSNRSKSSFRHSPALTNDSQSAFESGEDDNESFDDILFPEIMDSLTLKNYNDDNDFENGLDIGNQSILRLKNKNNITCSNPRQRRELFTVDFNISSRDSRPSTPNNNNNSSPLHKLKTNKVFSKSLTSLNTPTQATKKNTTKSVTIPKNQDNNPKNPHSSKNPKLPPIKGLTKKKSTPLIDNNLKRSKSTSVVTNSTSKLSKKTTTSNSTPLLNKRTPKSNNNKKKGYNHQNTNPNNNTRTTNMGVMRKPARHQSFGDGTELDGFDDLPINMERERPYFSNNCDKKNNASFVCFKPDNIQHHQKHKHKKNRKKRKPQLIRNLNVDKSPKVVGEMVYNPMTQCWDGNDSVLKEFNNALTSPTRPALISNMNKNNQNANTMSFQVVGKMKFDPIKMCWNNDSSDEDEEIWAGFDDDRDCISSSQSLSDVDDNIPTNIERNKLRTKLHHAYSADDVNGEFQVGSEFDITSGFLAALLASERQHRNEITRWYPDALSKKNNSRFGLRGITLQRSYLYDLRNKNNNLRRNSSGSNSKIYNHSNRSGGLFEAAVNLTRPERRHFH